MKPRKKRKSAAFGPIDVQVGSRVKMLRDLLGMKQTALGDAVGVSFPQLQKYERGANRIGASRLFELSQVLDVPVSFFFDDMPEEIAGRRIDGLGLTELEILSMQGSEEILRAYYSIEDGAIRSALFQFVKALARSGRDRQSSRRNLP